MATWSDSFDGYVSGNTLVSTGNYAGDAGIAVENTLARSAANGVWNTTATGRKYCFYANKDTNGGNSTVSLTFQASGSSFDAMLFARCSDTNVLPTTGYGIYFGRSGGVIQVFYLSGGAFVGPVVSCSQAFETGVWYTMSLALSGGNLLQVQLTALTGVNAGKWLDGTGGVGSWSASSSVFVHNITDNNVTAAAGYGGFAIGDEGTNVAQQGAADNFSFDPTTVASTADTTFLPSARVPNPRVGPMVLRKRNQLPPYPQHLLAPLTNTEFIPPCIVPNPRVGPMVLRQKWRHPPPIPGIDLAPVTNTEFVFPVRNLIVGPTVLQGLGGRIPPYPSHVLAPVTDSEFGYRVQIPNPRVGPTALRRAWRQQFYYPIVNQDQSTALSGQSLTVSAGTLTTAIDIAITGQDVATSAGTMTAEEDLALSGQALATSAGTLGIAGDLALSGQVAASSTGTLGVKEDVALAGQALTSSLGTVTANNTCALTGQEATSSAGTLSAQFSVTLTGQAATTSLGAVGVEEDLALSGQVATSAQGTLAPTTDLTGQQTATTSGTLRAGEVLALSGSELASSSGIIATRFEVALTGQALATSLGTIAPLISVLLVGQVLFASQGALSEGQALTGQVATVSQGDLVPVLVVGLSGQYATLSQGTLAPAGPPAAATGVPMLAFL